jgi:hypothetical protein
LTDTQAIIVTTSTASEVRSVPLKTVSDLKLTERRDGRGTIEFGKPKFSFFGSRASRAVPWPGTGHYLVPAFEAIENARQVYDLIVQAQRQS